LGIPASFADRLPRLPARYAAAAALALLCVSVLVLGLWQAVGDSPTIDEPVYLSAGLTALTRHDLRLNPQHPPLAKVLAAAAALPARPALPSGRVWARAHERSYSRVFLERLRRDGKLREVTLLSRLIPLLELMATAVAVYALARRLGGPVGGVFAAGLWLLDPFVVGIGHVDGIDVPFTLAALSVALALVRWLESRTLARAAWIGLACGAALVIRDTGPLLLAVAAATVAIAARDLRPALVLGAVAMAVVWAVYGALDPAYTLHHMNVLPQRYVDGFDALADAHGGPASGYLLGRHWTGGRWWYWPASMAVKLPVTLLAGWALALVLAFARRGAADAGAARRTYVAVLPAALVIAAFTVATPVDLGLRYLLPAIALLTVCVAPLVRAPRLLPALLLAGSAAFTIASVPHSLAWTAPPFRPGYRAATDANLDWGQDAYRVQRWARGRHAWIACYSPKGVGCARGVAGARPLPKHADPARIHGWVAISSTLLNLDRWDPWLRRIHPTGVLGGTVLLYRLPAPAPGRVSPG
jgi:hypothetical protein